AICPYHLAQRMTQIEPPAQGPDISKRPALRQRAFEAAGKCWIDFARGKMTGGKPLGGGRHFASAHAFIRQRLQVAAAAIVLYACLLIITVHGWCRDFAPEPGAKQLLELAQAIGLHAQYGKRCQPDVFHRAWTEQFDRCKEAGSLLRRYRKAFRP